MRPTSIPTRWRSIPLYAPPAIRRSEQFGSGDGCHVHRHQPNLEVPGIDYMGRSIYTTFGLEGVNNGLDGISREDLLQAFFNWAMDEPTVSITNTTFEMPATSPCSRQ